MRLQFLYFRLRHCVCFCGKEEKGSPIGLCAAYRPKYGPPPIHPTSPPACHKVHSTSFVIYLYVAYVAMYVCVACIVLLLLFWRIMFRSFFKRKMLHARRRDARWLLLLLPLPLPTASGSGSGGSGFGFGFESASETTRSRGPIPPRKGGTTRPSLRLRRVSAPRSPIHNPHLQLPFLES